MDDDPTGSSFCVGTRNRYAEFLAGATSRALRLENHQITNVNKSQIPGLKMLALFFQQARGAFDWLRPI